MTAAERGRLVAGVLLDAVIVWSDDAPPDENAELMNLAIRRLDEIGAWTATPSDDDGEVTLDVSDLVGPAIVTINWLATRLAEVQGRDRLEVISDARQFWERA